MTILTLSGCSALDVDEERETPRAAESAPHTEEPTGPSNSAGGYAALHTPQIPSDIPPEGTADPAMRVPEESWRRVAQWRQFAIHLGSLEGDICALVASPNGGMQTCGTWGEPLYLRYRAEGVDMSMVVVTDDIRTAAFGRTSCAVRGNLAATAQPPRERFNVTVVDGTGTERDVVTGEGAAAADLVAVAECL